MSYDLMVFDPRFAPSKHEDFQAWSDQQTNWAEGHSYDDPAVTTDRLKAWYADMRLQFPNMNGPDAYEPADDHHNPRVTGYSIGKAMIYVDFRWSEADAALAALRSLAVKHRVGFLNPGEENWELWFPPDPPAPEREVVANLVLSIEGQPDYKEPSSPLIYAAVDWLRAERAPGFLVLGKTDGDDYTQIAGADDAFTLEWREYVDGDFRHLVAGLPGGDSETEIEIIGSGEFVSVKANEKLSSRDVKALLMAFATGEPWPKQFVWRDMTGQFKRQTPPAQARPWWQFWK